MHLFLFLVLQQRKFDTSHSFIVAKLSSNREKNAINYPEIF